MRRQYHSRQVGNDKYVWDVHRLVRLSRGLETQMVPLDQIKALDENWWYEGTSRLPTPRAFGDHMKLVQEADLQYPIILCAEGCLMDGMHRVVKAYIAGQEQIAAKIFPVTPDPDFMNVDVSTLSYDEPDLN